MVPPDRAIEKQPRAQTFPSSPNDASLSCVYEVEHLNLLPMKYHPRLLIVALSILLGLAASAQYTVVVNGQLSPCDPANAGGTVIASTMGFMEPPQSVTATLDTNCDFFLIMTLMNPAGNLYFATSCGNGSMATDTVAYDVGSSPADSLTITLNCGPTNLCNAAFTVQQAMGGGMMIPWQITTTNQSTGDGTLSYQWWMPDGSTSTEAEPSWTFNAAGVYGICLTITADNGQCTDFLCDSVVVDTNGMVSTASVWYDCTGTLWGSELPGTDCLTFLGDLGTWNANCVCVPDSVEVECQALFTVEQASGNGALIPWTVNIVDQSTGTGNLSYWWDLPNGSTSTAAEPAYTFNAPGWYPICLTVSSDNGCTSTFCDSVVVDTNGFISTAPVWYDCEGVLWGPAVAGTSCDDGDPMTTGEVWTADCICTADSTNLGCEAGFWAIQAYDSVPGGVAPIPNEVWVWNLSSGGNGPYQFFWDFGDGTSSTEAYPTHVYSGNGPWLLCLTMVSDSCTDTYCDSISVDENGFLNGLVIDGHGIPNSTDRSEGFTLNVISEIPTGINELHADAELRLWPNPVDNALNVAFRSLGGSGMLSIIDGNGRTVKAIAERFTSGTNRLTVPVDELAPGLYLMRLSNGNNSISARFLKTR